MNHRGHREHGVNRLASVVFSVAVPGWMGKSFLAELVSIARRSFVWIVIGISVVIEAVARVVRVRAK